MRALAEALYAVSYLEWAILGDLPRLKARPVNLSITELSRLEMGKVAGRITEHAGIRIEPAEAAWLRAAADALEQVVGSRNGVVHAHPATIGSQQMLYWWAAKRRRPHEAYAVTELRLHELRDLAFEHIRILSGLRLPS